MADHAHPIQVNLETILPILAKEIYNTPYAFLRENIQNAVDAIRIERFREQVEQRSQSDHAVRIAIDGTSVSISDTGIGMSREELRNCYWNIGQSGKHTPEAKAAGVVGTFGIGGMANFGVCSKITIQTRRAVDARATVCVAEKSSLSASEECVFYSDGSVDAPRGTVVSALLDEAIIIASAQQYLEPICRYLEIPVYLGDQILSLKPFPRIEREPAKRIVVQDGGVKLSLVVTADHNGRAEADIEGMELQGRVVPGVRGHFSIGGSISAYQHGFMLARVPVSTIFRIGGNLDCPLLRPTAGREALISESQSVVQRCVSLVDSAIAEYIATTPGLADQFSSLFQYIAATARWELSELATIRSYGSNNRVTLRSLRDESKNTEVCFCQEKHDRATMEAIKGQGKVVVQLSTETQRQKVEQHYLTQYCRARQIADRVSCLRVFDSSTLSWSDYGFVIKLKQRLKSQFFIQSMSVQSGELTHQAMLFAPPKGSGAGMVLIVDLRHPNLQRLIKMGDYHASGAPVDPYAYDALFDRFVCDTVFPHLESAFPELRNRDFDVLLRRLQSTVEYFQIDPSDLKRLNLLAEVTDMSPEEVARVVGAARSGQASASVVARADVVDVAQVMETPTTAQVSPVDVERLREEFLIKLLTKEINAKVLDASSVVEGFGMGGHYLALTPEAHILYRRVLERRPSADFTWGGYRAGFVFYEEGQCVLYYDIELPTLVSPEHVDASPDRAGTQRLDRDLVMCKNMIFVPIPKGFETYFVPREKTLRFTIRHQILGHAWHSESTR
jgi:molecular chaperone HtpG